MRGFLLVQSMALIIPTLRVGMLPRTLCVQNCWDAERP
jgi:hypothetical protein